MRTSKSTNLLSFFTGKSIEELQNIIFTVSKEDRSLALSQSLEVNFSMQKLIVDWISGLLGDKVSKINLPKKDLSWNDNEEFVSFMKLGISNYPSKDKCIHNIKKISESLNRNKDISPGELRRLLWYGKFIVDYNRD